MASRDFIRDTAGRFARTAGRRVAKKVKKAAKAQLSRELTAAQAKAEKLVSDSVDQVKALRAQAKIDRAQKLVDKWEAEHAALEAKSEVILKQNGGEYPEGDTTGYDAEYAYQQAVKAKLRLEQAKEGKRARGK